MSNVAIPKSQRALVFQGGGSLGAYEAGVFHVLYHWIKKDIHNDRENIFDIIEGTSIGAINASIISSHILERKEEEFKGQGIVDLIEGEYENSEKIIQLREKFSWFLSAEFKALRQGFTPDFENCDRKDSSILLKEKYPLAT